MKKIVAIIIASVVIFSLSSSAIGQNKTDFSLGLSGMYGVNSLHYEVDQGSHNTGWEAQFAFETKVYFWDNIGIGIGILHSRYSAESSLSNYTSTTLGVSDSEGDLFDLNVESENLHEKNKADYLEVPITFEYRMKSEEKISYTASLGVVVSFHLDSKTTTSADYLNVTADYNQWNAHLFDIPQRGLTSEENWRNEVYDEFQNSIGLILQTGVDYKINEGVTLTLGLYAQLGLSNCLKEESSEMFIDTENPNSIASTSDPVRLRTLGLRLGIKVFDSF